ncbi:MAG TPA: tetratricopeptide repeat protein [Longimicrobiales bacterium]|nr:tetratricopeptide repeat protein [Longimicrobiales bacterium]
MNRSSRFACTLVLGLLLVPAAARAQQEPKDNKWTKDATKLLTIAQLQQKPELYQQALTALQEGMQKDPTNAKVWLLAGQIQLGMEKYTDADASLKKAVELYPKYAEDIEPAREQAWLKLFQAGAAAMDRNQADSAVALLTQAESIYAQRPEAVLNLGMLYANSGKPDEATKAFAAAKERLHGPLFAKLKPEDQAQWKQYEAVADLTLSQVEGNRGIEAFNAGKYDEAVAAFKKAAAVNPNSRDYVYNLAQAIYAQVDKLEKDRKAAKPADVKQIDAQLVPLYKDVIPVVEKSLTFDPASLDSYVIIGRAYRGLALAAADPKEKTSMEAKATEVLGNAQKLAFEVSDVAVSFGEQAKLNGNIKNRTAKPGEPLKLKVSFIGIDGNVIGSGDVSVAASTPDKPVPFEVSAPVQGQVAGWKYEIVK